TAGTILQGTKQPLRLWFKAACILTKPESNARTLERELGLTYKVAWTWTHKLRSVMKLAPTVGAPVMPEPATPIACKIAMSRWAARGGGLQLTFGRQKSRGCGCLRLNQED